MNFDQPPANGLADLKARFGNLVVDVARQEIISPVTWEAVCMTRLDSLPGYPNRLYCNKAIVAPLTEALSRCVALADGYQVKSIGCFAPRRKRVNGDLSVHSWGLAVDINPLTNPLAPLPGPVAPVGGHARDIPDSWVSVFEGLGWTWGGRFRRADPMHFQWISGY